MEIQTFILAGTIRYCERHRNYTATQLSACSFAPEDAKFPFCLTVNWLLVLAQTNRYASEPVTLRFHTVDSNNNKIAGPAGELIGSFAYGQKFQTKQGEADFTFPSPGDYRIDFFTGDSIAPVYAYHIEVTSEGFNPPP